MLVEQRVWKAAKYVVPTWVLKTIQVLSDVTACRLVQGAAMKKNGERYSGTPLTIYQSARCNNSKDLRKFIALMIEGYYFI